MSEKRTKSEARIPQSEIGALYDGLAWMYDAWGTLTETKARKRSIELAAIEDGQHVLEVAVGTGLGFEAVVGANPNGRNVGIDLSRGMLSKAERRLQKAGRTRYELRVGTALDLEEEDGTFDFLLNNFMFDLLAEDDWPKALSEFHRVLKPGGRLVLVNMTLGERFGSRFYERLYRLSPSLMGGCRGVRLSTLVDESGFTVQSREYYQQMLFPSEVILAVRS